jgi:hypothetical protein
VWPGCFLHEYERGGRHFDGKDPGPAHPFVEALRGAVPGEVERLVPTQGTVIQLFLGEDELVRGLRERTAAGPGDFAWGLRVAHNTPYDRSGRLPDLESPTTTVRVRSFRCAPRSGGAPYVIGILLLGRTHASVTGIRGQLQVGYLPSSRLSSQGSWS